MRTGAYNEAITAYDALLPQSPRGIVVARVPTRVQDTRIKPPTPSFFRPAHASPTHRAGTYAGSLYTDPPSVP